MRVRSPSPALDPRYGSSGHGAWRSLVAHSAGGRKVAGSNPVAPISVTPLQSGLHRVYGTGTVRPGTAGTLEDVPATALGRLGPSGRYPGSFEWHGRTLLCH